jgi:hypothetical protein
MVELKIVMGKIAVTQHKGFSKASYVARIAKSTEIECGSASKGIFKGRKLK